MNSTGSEAGPGDTAAGATEAGTGCASAADSSSTTIAAHRPLQRPRNDRMLAGVASGLSRYLGVDVLPIRIAIVVLCFVGGIGLPLYLASWILIPEEGAEQSIAANVIQSIQGKSI